jgi:protein involved in ribonucleotide reduction
MGGLVYFSSASANTHRFVQALGLPAQRLPIESDDPLPVIDGPFILVTPTFADGEGRNAVPKQVIRLLNDAGKRSLLRGVIAGGNRNFGETFALAGEVIAKKCNVPVLYRFELAGTQTDIARVQTGLEKFWRHSCSTTE